MGTGCTTQVAWAYAQNNEQCPELFNALGDFAAEHVLDFSPTALADTTWGFVQCGSPNPRLLDRVGTCCTEELEAWTSRPNLWLD